MAIKYSNSRGFTLIEMMVVLLVVGVLAGIVLVNMFDVTKGGRDEKRVNDLELLKLGFRLYVEEYGTYPDCTGGIQIEVGGSTITGGSSSCADGTQMQAFLNSYFSGSRLPADPKGPGSNDYYYYYDSIHNCNDPASASTASRVIFAVNMERPVASNKATVCGSATGVDGGYDDTTSFGGTINPSQPYVVILERL